MHEMEFLPDWYPHLRRRKRMVVLQLWATVLVAFGFGLWVFLAKGNVAARQIDHRSVARQLEQSRADLHELNNQLNEKQKLEAEQRIVSKVGLHVEATRLLGKLDQIMPREMTIVEANFDTLDMPLPLDPMSDNRVQKYARKLMVHLSGVTPSDADWAGVLAKLSSVPFFQDVRLVAAHDKVDQGHLMRQFEVSFMVDLGTGG